MSKVLVDRDLILHLLSCWDVGLEIDNELAQLRIAAAQPAEADGVDLAPFWVLFDATAPDPFIKKMMPEGVLAFFDSERDAARAKARNPGTDYRRAPYVRQSDHLAALSAVTAERDRLREALNFACKALCQVTSSDGSGHADIALSVLRLAGVGADEREALVEGWKANVKWRADAALTQSPKGEEE